MEDAADSFQKPNVIPAFDNKQQPNRTRSAAENRQAIGWCHVPREHVVIEYHEDDLPNDSKSTVRLCGRRLDLGAFPLKGVPRDFKCTSQLTDAPARKLKPLGRFRSGMPCREH